MSKAILLIDDKEDFKEDFKTKSQANGYALAYGKSLDDLKAKLPRIHKKIVAVILDIKCLIKNDQEIEKPDFIGAALNYLNQDYPDLPRLILTGDEQALEGIKMFYNTDTEDIYKKTPSDIDELFLKLDVHYKDYPNRILTLEEKELNSIIQRGEGKYLEFKSSLQYCVKENTPKKALRFEVLKNIAAFANTDGGEILIGVEDNGNILGLEETDFKTNNNSEDSYRLLFDSLIETNFGNSFQELMSDMKFYKIENKSVAHLTISKSLIPIYLKNKDKDGNKYDAFFIRRLASAKELSKEERESYVKSNWNKK